MLTSTSLPSSERSERLYLCTRPCLSVFYPGEVAAPLSSDPTQQAAGLPTPPAKGRRGGAVAPLGVLSPGSSRRLELRDELLSLSLSLSLSVSLSVSLFLSVRVCVCVCACVYVYACCVLRVACAHRGILWAEAVCPAFDPCLQALVLVAARCVRSAC